MERHMLKTKIGQQMSKARNKKNMSQNDMANHMNITRKTVSNWETGVNAPGIDDVLEWFRILNENPIPYLLELIFPESFHINESIGSEDARKIIRDAIASYPDEHIMAIYYILFGSHGSSPYAFTQLCLADLQCPIGDRQTVSSIVINNYQRAKERGEITSPEGPLPDMISLKEADRFGREAYITGQTGYFAK